MRRNGKRSMVVLLALAILFGIFCIGITASDANGETQTEIVENRTLGASAACEGHTLGTFSGVPACVNENGELHICENNFPDENFRAYVLGLTGAEDGYFSVQECGDVSQINVSSKSIETLQGVEFFISLTSLYCYGNQLTELDVSNNSTLFFLWCGANQLTELDVSNNKALADLECYSNQLTKLNVSGCVALDYLDCRNNQLKKLDISNCSALVYLDFYGNELTELNASGCSALTRLDCCYNDQLTKLDVSGCSSLIYLDCSDNQLTELDVSGCIALTSLRCDTNQLTELDVSSCTALTVLECNNNQLARLDAGGCTALTQLTCYNQHIRLPIIYSAGCWKVNLGQIFPPENISRDYGVSAGEWDPQTGIVTFTENPLYFTYYYKTGSTARFEMDVNVSLWEPAVFYIATINGTPFEYIPNQEIPLSANSSYVNQGWGYRFAGWSGDTDVIADTGSSTTTVTMPER
ncbi:MAG: leucine-rich repeat domain-containing protein, partial [Clostridiales bacterium]|nr:leucine-rich repeat domain-containing protein [Clostridiales bacterium]